MIRAIMCGMVLTSLVLTVGAGCSTTTTEGNQSLTEGNVTKITKGVTTRAEIEDILGQPDEVTLLPDGCRTMTYQGSETKFDWLSVVVQGLMPFYVPMKDPNTTRRQVLQIILDRNNVVEDYEFENGGTETTQTASAFGTHSETKSGVADPTTQGSPN